MLPLATARQYACGRQPPKEKELVNKMAQKVHIVLEDDLDGSDATQTVAFALDGTTYEIDLNDKNAGALRDALAKYVGHARKVSGIRRGRRSASSSTTGGHSAKEIRDWARSNGHKVPERGRIPADVREAFEAAH